MQHRTTITALSIIAVTALTGCARDVAQDTSDAEAVVPVVPVVAAPVTEEPAPVELPTTSPAPSEQQPTAEREQQPPAATTPEEPVAAVQPEPAGDVDEYTDDGGVAPIHAGCTPGSEDLPDGTWFGFVTTVGQDITFDLACYYVHEGAHAVAAEHGEQATDGYYIVNDSALLRTLPVAEDAIGFRLTEDLDSERVDLTAMFDGTGYHGDACPGAQCPVTIVVEDGTVVRLAQEYTA